MAPAFGNKSNSESCKWWKLRIHYVLVDRNMFYSETSVEMRRTKTDIHFDTSSKRYTSMTLGKI